MLNIFQVERSNERFFALMPFIKVLWPTLGYDHKYDQSQTE